MPASFCGLGFGEVRRCGEAKAAAVRHREAKAKAAVARWWGEGKEGGGATCGWRRCGERGHVPCRRGVGGVARVQGQGCMPPACWRATQRPGGTSRRERIWCLQSRVARDEASLMPSARWARWRRFHAMF